MVILSLLLLCLTIQKNKCNKTNSQAKPKAWSHIKKQNYSSPIYTENKLHVINAQGKVHTPVARSVSFISCFLLLHISLFYRRFRSYLEFLTLPPSVLSLFLPILLVAIKFKNLREEQASLRSSMDPKIHWYRNFTYVHVCVFDDFCCTIKWFTDKCTDLFFFFFFYSHSHDIWKFPG